MDKQPATLIDQQESVISWPTGQAPINTWQERPSVPYFSPAALIAWVQDAVRFGVPYWMQGLAVQSCNTNYITAPSPWQKSYITHQANTLYTAGQAPIGQAPTSGIYTGVEDHC